jgi:hypothetical protein
MFPDGINFTDLDGFVELNGRFLIQEWKWPGTPITDGQHKAFLSFSRLPGCAVYLINGDVGKMQPTSIRFYWQGKCGDERQINLDDLRRAIKKWAVLADGKRMGKWMGEKSSHPAGTLVGEISKNGA